MTQPDKPGRLWVGRALTVHQPYAWALAAGVKTTEHRSWSTAYRGRVFIHAGLRTDPDAPAGLRPPGGQPLAFGAVLGWVTLAVVDGEPGAYVWRVTGPHLLPEPVTGVRGWPGLWYWALPTDLR